MSDLFMRLNADTLPAIRALERVGYSLERLAGTADESSSQMRASWAEDRSAANALADRIAADAEKQIAAWKLWEEELNKYVAQEGAALTELVALHDAAVARLSQNPGLATMHAQRIQQLQAERAGVIDLAAQEGAAAQVAIAAAQQKQVAIGNAADAHIQKVKEQERAEEEQAANRTQRAEQFRQQVSSASMSMVIGGAVILGFTALAADGMFHAAKAAADFDSQMILLHTHANISVADVAILREGILRLAPAIGIGPEALAMGMYHVSSSLTSLAPSMQNAAGQMEILTRAAQLSKIGHAELEVTVSAVTGVMAAYKDSNLTAAEAAGILNTTVGEGNMRMQDLDMALRNGVGPVAAEAGVKLQSLGAALATLTDLGIPAARAATYLRSAIIQMTMPSGPAITALGAIGLGADEARKRTADFSRVLELAGVSQSVVAEKLRSSGSLAETMAMLKEKLDATGMSSQQSAALMARAFGGIRSGTGVVSLVDNLAGLEQKERDATQAAHSFQATWEYFNSQDPDQAMSRLMSGLKTMEVDLGQQLLPLVLQLVGKLADFVAKIDVWIEHNGALVRTLAPILLIGGALLGAVLLIGGAIGFLVIGLGALSGAGGVIFALFAAGVAVVGLIAAAFMFAHSHAKEIGDYYQGHLAPIVANLVQIWNGLSAAFSVMASVIMPQVIAGLSGFWKWLNDTHGPLTDLEDVLGRVTKAFATWMQSKDFHDLMAALAVYLPRVIGIVVDSFEVLIDVVSTVLIAIVGIANVQTDLMAGDFAKAGRDIKASWSDMGSHIQQVTKDSTRLASDTTDLWSAKTTKQFHDTSDGIALAVDDAMRPLPGKVKTSLDGVNGVIDDQKPTTFTKARTLGAQLSGGVIQGIVDNQAALNAATADAVRGALSSARGVANVSSPSRLFRDELGVHLSAGIAAGIMAGGPGINAAMSSVVRGALVNSNALTMKPLIGGQSLAHNSTASDASSPQGGGDDPALEILRDIRDAVRDGQRQGLPMTAKTSGVGAGGAGPEGDPGTIAEAALYAIQDRARQRARRGGSLGNFVLR